MTTTLPTGWGGGGFGRTPWGAGSSVPFGLTDVLAVRENVLRLSFTSPPYLSGVGDPGDSADVSHYGVRAVSGVGIDGEPVRPVSPVSAARSDVAGAGGRLIDLTLDRPLSQWPCLYSVTVRNLRSTTGMVLAPGSTRTLYAMQAGLRAPTPDLLVASRDIANPQVLSDLFDPLPNAANLGSSVLGTYVPDGLGDYAADGGLTSYRKRVIRRLTTKKNAFAHLPGYGLLDDQVKRLALPGIREAFASDAEDQIRQEPETVACSVNVVVRDGITIYQVRADTTLGNTGFDVPVPKKG